MEFSPKFDVTQGFWSHIMAMFCVVFFQNEGLQAPSPFSQTPMIMAVFSMC